MSAQCRKSNGSGTRHRTTGCKRRPIFPPAFVLLVLIAFPGEASAFQIPEVLNYDLTWTGIKAGEASLEIRDKGNEILITSTARSVKWVSVFYTVDDRVESRVAKNHSSPVIGNPLRYLLRLREGRHRKNKEVIFDARNAKAVYIDHLDRERKEFAVPSVVFDPLSSFYYLRTLKLEVGKPVYVTIFDDKKVWKVEVQVLRKERIEVPAGGFNTIVVKPLMRSEGIFSRRGEIYIWLTDDDRRLPVLVKTKVKIGSVNASLVGGRY
ncbi:MAG: DUF3108 domain-containing protein [Nitrospirae bacterium]|nr:DUF3108 domain-containing protein [Nitrospirota bacterium]